MAPTTTTTAFLLMAGAAITLIQPCPAPVIPAAVAAGVAATTAADVTAGAGAVSPVAAVASAAKPSRKKRATGTDWPDWSSSGSCLNTTQALFTMRAGGMEVSGLPTGFADVVNTWNSYPNITSLEAAYGKVAISGPDSMTIWDYPAVTTDFVDWGVANLAAQSASTPATAPTTPSGPSNPGRRQPAAMKV